MRYLRIASPLMLLLTLIQSGCALRDDVYLQLPAETAGVLTIADQDLVELFTIQSMIGKETRQMLDTAFRYCATDLSSVRRIDLFTLSPDSEGQWDSFGGIATFATDASTLADPLARGERGVRAVAYRDYQYAWIERGATAVYRRDGQIYVSNTRLAMEKTLDTLAGGPSALSNAALVRWLRPHAKAPVRGAVIVPSHAAKVWGSPFDTIKGGNMSVQLTPRGLLTLAVDFRDPNAAQGMAAVLDGIARLSYGSLKLDLVDPKGVLGDTGLKDLPIDVIRDVTEILEGVTTRTERSTMHLRLSFSLDTVSRLLKQLEQAGTNSK